MEKVSCLTILFLTVTMKGHRPYIWNVHGMPEDWQEGISYHRFLQEYLPHLKKKCLFCVVIYPKGIYFIREMWGCNLYFNFSVCGEVSCNTWIHDPASVFFFFFVSYSNTVSWCFCLVFLFSTSHNFISLYFSQTHSWVYLHISIWS